MKPVTVYTLDKKEVMVYDGQNVFEYFDLRDSWPIDHSDYGFVSISECKVKKIQLPIRLYKTIGEEDLYIAWDREVLKLLGLEEEQVKCKLVEKDNTIEQLNTELEKIRNMSAWETVKVAWSKFWDKE